MKAGIVRVDSSLRKLLIVLLLLAVSIPSIYAADASQNGSIVIDTPVNHDLFVSGDTVAINAPVDGDVWAAANLVSINAAVSGDVFAAGSTVNLNAPVGGSVVAAGSQVEAKGDVKGRIVAAGGTLILRGNALKVVAAGGTIRIESTAVIEKYAYIAGGTVTNAGTIKGELRVNANNLENTGTAGSVQWQRTKTQTNLAGLSGALSGIGMILGILTTIGFLLLGIVLLRLFPKQFLMVHDQLVKSPIKNTVVGFLLIIAAAIVSVLLAITVIGLPFAAVFGMLFIITLMVSGLFVSLALGRKIASPTNLKASDMWLFVLGFVILTVLFYIPFLGWIIRVVAVSLGFGATFYALRQNWASVRTTPP
jgi:hypothetical protein